MRLNLIFIFFLIQEQWLLETNKYGIDSIEKNIGSTSIKLGIFCQYHYSHQNHLTSNTLTISETDGLFSLHMQLNGEYQCKILSAKNTIVNVACTFDQTSGTITATIPAGMNEFNLITPANSFTYNTFNLQLNLGSLTKTITNSLRSIFGYGYILYEWNSVTEDYNLNYHFTILADISDITLFDLDYIIPSLEGVTCDIEIPNGSVSSCTTAEDFQVVHVSGVSLTKDTPYTIKFRGVPRQSSAEFKTMFIKKSSSVISHVFMSYAEIPFKLSSISSTNYERQYTTTLTFTFTFDESDFPEIVEDACFAFSFSEGSDVSSASVSDGYLISSQNESQIKIIYSPSSRRQLDDDIFTIEIANVENPDSDKLEVEILVYGNKNDNNLALYRTFEPLSVELCDSGKVWENNQCSSCTSPCLTCKGTSNTCTSCEENYYLDGSSCVECGEHCAVCDDSGLCISCKDSFYLNSNSCLDCSTLNCESCPDNVCESCLGNLVLNNDICEECVVEHCELCEFTGLNCVRCSDPYIISGEGAKCILSEIPKLKQHKLSSAAISMMVIFSIGFTGLLAHSIVTVIKTFFSLSSTSKVYFYSDNAKTLDNAKSLEQFSTDRKNINCIEESNPQELKIKQ